MMAEDFSRACEILKNASHAVVFTGAGISVESGIPPFRGPDGLWNKVDPSFLELENFFRDPVNSWRLIKEIFYDFIGSAKPNPAHFAVARLEQAGIVKSVITQNIDNLHQKAGSRSVIEFHGNMLYAKCLECERRYSYAEVMDIVARRTPPSCACGGVLKPDAVFFGEAIPPDALSTSFEEAARCDLMLVIGTSAQVEPAASLPYIAKGREPMLFRFMHVGRPHKECHVIEINREPTPLTGHVSDFIIQGSAGEALALIVEHLKSRMGLP